MRLGAFVAGQRRQRGVVRARSRPDARARRDARRGDDCRAARAARRRPRAMVAGAIHGMSASATIQPSASARGSDAAGEARAHAFVRARASTIRAPGRAQRARERSNRPGRTTATTSSSSADRDAGRRRRRWRARADAVRRRRQRREQLVSAEARAAARGEQDADRRMAARDWSRSVDRRSACRSRRSFRQQPELAVLDDDEHARALVHAVVVGRATC